MPSKAADEAATLCHTVAISDVLEALRSGGLTVPSGSKAPGKVSTDASKLAAALANLDVQDPKVRVCVCVCVCRLYVCGHDHCSWCPISCFESVHRLSYSCTAVTCTCLPACALANSHSLLLSQLSPSPSVESGGCSAPQAVKQPQAYGSDRASHPQAGCQRFVGGCRGGA